MNLNNDLQESYCSYDLSKILKDKGFDANCKTFYYHGSFINLPEGSIVSDEWVNERLVSNTTTKRPSHSLAIDWIFVNFGIYR